MVRAAKTVCAAEAIGPLVAGVEVYILTFGQFSLIDALHYLVACLDEPRTIGRSFDIGGPDVLTYRELLQTTARALGLRLGAGVQAAAGDQRVGS